MPWRPNEPGEFPTLGWVVIDWMGANLCSPDRTEWAELVLTRDQAKFLLDLYRLDPLTGRRVYRRGVLSTPKGWGSSPLLAMVAAVESLGPVVPAGWDSKGQPVGRPWSSLRIVETQLAAVSEGQTGNSFKRLLGMLRLGEAMVNYPGLDPMQSFVVLPDSGRISYVTSAAASHEGNPIVFAGLDQTEAWLPGNGGVKFADVLRRNVGKNDGLTLEAPNSYRPGERSVAETSAEAAKVDDGILYVHKQARVKDLADLPKLRSALEVVYGESAQGRGGWVNLDRIMAEIADPATEESDARQYYLNEPVAPESTWIYRSDWDACGDTSQHVDVGEAITLGFDGAQYDDSTALIGCRVSDGHLFVLGIWEKPDGQAGVGWEVDRDGVDAAIEFAFDVYDVRLMWPDPWGDWRPYVDRWAARWPGRVVEFDTRHVTKMCRALERLHADVRNHTVTHDGDEILARHMAQARKKYRGDLYVIAKDQRKSPRKIDAAVAATLAFAARTAAPEVAVKKSYASAIW